MTSQDYRDHGGTQSEFAEQIDLLRRWADGYLPYMGAVYLLTGTPAWPALRPLLTRSDDLIAWLDTEGALPRVNASGLSGSQRRIALLVLELAEVDSGAPLSELVAGLDRDVSMTVLRAISIVSGDGEEYWRRIVDPLRLAVGL